MKNNFRTNFIRERRKLNLSQHQIADKLEINQKTIGSYEEGRALPPLDGIIKIADFFKITVDELIK